MSTAITATKTNAAILPPTAPPIEEELRSLSLDDSSKYWTELVLVNTFPYPAGIVTEDKLYDCKL